MLLCIKEMHIMCVCLCVYYSQRRSKPHDLKGLAIFQYCRTDRCPNLISAKSIELGVLATEGPSATGTPLCGLSPAGSYSL